MTTHLYEVSLEEVGARVTTLAADVDPQDIADHIEEETWFTVECMEVEE